jgi:hypothetical protein
MRSERCQKGAEDGEDSEKRTRDGRARHVRLVWWPFGDDQAEVEHSAAPPARLRAFRTHGYNFRSRKKPEQWTTAAGAGAARLIFWSAGSQELKPRPGESWTMKPGSDLLLITHLKTTGKKLMLQLQIGLCRHEWRGVAQAIEAAAK